MCSWYCAGYLRYEEKHGPIAAFRNLCISEVGMGRPENRGKQAVKIEYGVVCGVYS